MRRGWRYPIRATADRVETTTAKCKSNRGVRRSSSNGAAVHGVCPGTARDANHRADCGQSRGWGRSRSLRLRQRVGVPPWSIVRLQIPRLQAGMCGEAVEHALTQFLVGVKAEGEVRPAGALERAVRSRLTLDAPADSEESSEHLARPGCWPGRHAAVKVTLISSGGASRCSRRSAMTRSASACTRAIASLRSPP